LSASATRRRRKAKGRGTRMICAKLVGCAGEKKRLTRGRTENGDLNVLKRRSGAALVAFFRVARRVIRSPRVMSLPLRTDTVKK